jgi:hypothetical protein
VAAFGLAVAQQVLHLLVVGPLEDYGGLGGWTGHDGHPHGAPPRRIESGHRFLGHAGWSFLLFPVVSGALILVLIGWLYNNAVRKTRILTTGSRSTPLEVTFYSRRVLVVPLSTASDERRSGRVHSPGTLRTPRSTQSR